MNHNPGPGSGPSLPLSSYDPIANGGITPLLPAPLPGVCGIGIQQKKPKNSAGVGTIPLSSDGKKKKKADPCGAGGVGGGGEVPEPGTWLLMASGAAGLYWKARHKFSRLTRS